MVKAYKESAKITLEEANIITKELETTIEIQFNFNQQNIIFTLLSKYDAKIINFDAQERAIISAKIKLRHKDEILESLINMQFVEYKVLN